MEIESCRKNGLWGVIKVWNWFPVGSMWAYHFLPFICVCVCHAHVCSIVSESKHLHAIVCEEVTGEPHVSFFTFYYVCYCICSSLVFVFSCFIRRLAASNRSPVYASQLLLRVIWFQTHTYHHVRRTRALGIKFWSSQLSDGHFTHWGIFLTLA